MEKRRIRDKHLGSATLENVLSVISHYSAKGMMGLWGYFGTILLNSLAGNF
jgi:hypothetical protein